MSWNSPNYIKVKQKNKADPVYAVEPSAIDMLEPVVADGQIVFSESPIDIVMAKAGEVPITIVQVP